MMNKQQGAVAVVKVLRLKQVQGCVGLARSTIYDRMNPRSPRYDGSFPRPINLGGSAVGWLESDIHRWVDSRVSAGCFDPSGGRLFERKLSFNVSCTTEETAEWGAQ
jgi:prophage regulatory protein